MSKIRWLVSLIDLDAMRAAHQGGEAGFIGPKATIVHIREIWREQGRTRERPSS